jgi:undecaprenyl-diphosphatase
MARAPALSMTGVGAALVFLGLVALELAHGPFGAERDLLAELRRGGDPAMLEGPDWLTPFMKDITALGGSPILTLLTVLLVGFLAFRRDWARMGLVILVIAGQSIVIDVLKGLFDRARPDVAPHLAHVASPSFPSGHASSSASAYLLVVLLLAQNFKDAVLRRYVFAAAIILALTVGMSRVFLGVHYPSDVLAGWSFGLAWTIGWFALARR